MYDCVNEELLVNVWNCDTIGWYEVEKMAGGYDGSCYDDRYCVKGNIEGPQL